MNARTGEVALDAAWPIETIPPNPPVAMLNGYNGSALPDKAWADDVGRPVLLGFESAVDRAFSGAGGGVVDGNYSEDRYEGWGYPKACGTWTCAHDGNGTPGWALPNITDYFDAKWTTEANRGRTGPMTPYGNPAAIAAAVAGIVRAGGTFARWGVGTWGYGEGGGANQPPAFADCELLQSGNTPAMYPDTDHNWLYANVSVFAPYGLALPAPAPPQEEDDMHIELLVGLDGVTNLAMLVNGGFMDEDFGAAAPGDFLHVPAAAWEWVNRSDQNKKVQFFTVSKEGWEAVRARTTGTVDITNGVTSHVDTEAIATKVADKLAQRLSA